MKRILILAPRLDVMFKKGPVSAARGSISPIRVHWQNFVHMCSQEHQKRGDTVQILELPLWQFTPKIVEDINPNIVYIPHRESHNFPIATPDIEARYYMQTVFPWQFYVDSKGFAGGASFYPLKLSKAPSSTKCFDELREYAISGKSKFDQPQKGKISTEMVEPYVFFACQIPHDETIKHHSNVTVEQALEETLRAANKHNINVIIKGHPVNPGSMENLKKISTKYHNYIWVEDVSIHDLIPNAKAIVIVNSGVGMESLLYLKPVITFGRAEYDVVTFSADLNGKMYDLIGDVENLKINEEEIKKFFDTWCNITYNTTNRLDFIKLGE